MTPTTPSPISDQAGAAIGDPIPMLLFCPKCGTQHIDAPEIEPGRLISSGPNAGRAVRPRAIWTNPPHKSHLCHACGNIWRPADVATTGVASIKTKGKADTWDSTAATTGSAPVCEHEWEPMTVPHKECVKCGDVRLDHDASRAAPPANAPVPSSSHVAALRFIETELTQYLEGMPADDTSRKLRDVARNAANAPVASVLTDDARDAARYRWLSKRVVITDGSTPGLMVITAVDDGFEYGNQFLDEFTEPAIAAIAPREKT